MYQVIARKYRPQKFSDLLGQEHVRTTLENAITQRRIAHGYIFSGQRGTGKTTVARIMARCLNCAEGPTITPCGKCASCVEIPAGNAPDVIEIDAASNRGINEMRELRENVRYRPARDRYKVFIIDEAHQITSEAFNALLKTLEEPPEWVVFILCTTEVHKIPTTIASRCQQFSFRSVDFRELMARMQWICEQEGISADPEVLSILALSGEGSVRDSLSALDQAIACCGLQLGADEVRNLLGQFSLDSLGQVTEALSNADSRRMLDLVLELERNGRNLQHFCRELARYFRNLLVAKVAGANTRLIAAPEREQERLAEIAAGFSEEDLTRYLQLTLDLFKDLQFSLQPRLHLEMGLLRLVQAGRIIAIEEALAGVRAPAAASKPVKARVEAPRQAQPFTAPVAAPQQRSAPSPFERDSARKVEGSTASGAAPAPALVSAPAIEDNWKQLLYGKLVELGMHTTADAIEQADVAEAGNELRIVAPESCSLALGPMGASDLQKAIQQTAGRPMKYTVSYGTPQNTGLGERSPTPKETEASERALSHPEVKRFQELFPDAQVRQVRNLKE